MSTTIPEVTTDLDIFTDLTEGLEPSEPCESYADHTNPPPAKHLWWSHCTAIGCCEDCHQANIASNGNDWIGKRVACLTCKAKFTYGPGDIHYLGPLS